MLLLVALVGTAFLAVAVRADPIGGHVDPQIGEPIFEGTTYHGSCSGTGCTGDVIPLYLGGELEVRVKTPGRTIPTACAPGLGQPCTPPITIGEQVVYDETFSFPITAGGFTLSGDNARVIFHPVVPAIAYLKANDASPGDNTVALYHYHVDVTMTVLIDTPPYEETFRTSIPFATPVPVG